MKRRGPDGGDASQRGAVPSRPPRGASRANPSADGTRPAPKSGSSRPRRDVAAGSGASEAPRSRRQEGASGAARPKDARERRPSGDAASSAPRSRDGRASGRRNEPANDGGWTFGIHAVETILEVNPEDVVELLVQSGESGGARRRVREQAEAVGLRVREVSADHLARLLGDDANHQGVAAQLHPFEYTEAAVILATEGPQLILVLDEIQDPHNFGAILRSAVGLGASAVVIPKNRAVGVTPAVRKVSTGAAAQIPIARVTNLARFMEEAREAGFWAYGTAVDEGENVATVSFAERSMLVLGSEGTGMRPLVRRHCDMLLRLPLEGVESLNVSVACGIFLYAWRLNRTVSALS